jgi:glycosyltransferase involved in cell wall biosynthesis
MRICLLEPYDTGSHAAWLRGYAAHSAHEIAPLTLEGRFWRWRMQGGAVALARRYREERIRADLLLASDMLDLTTFLALTREQTHDLPVALYLHENQLTYPLRPGESRELQYAWVNYASMLCADQILFNSQYHLDTWFSELPRLLKHYPDHIELGNLAALRARSQVLPLGLDLGALDAHRPAEPLLGPAVVLWNHRWEYDKDPATFVRALGALLDRGVQFRLVLLGERFVSTPPEFEALRGRLGANLLQFGYAESRAAYARWLWDADIVVSTAIHEFFGAAVVEAIYCGCFPILPNRLTYPQFIPHAFRGHCLYNNEAELVALLQHAIAEIDATRQVSLRDAVARYDWSSLAPVYDTTLERVRPESRKAAFSASPDHVL